MVADTSGLDYDLIDMGNGRKLERFGSHLLDRPEIEAKGRPMNPDKWAKADFFFKEGKGKKGEWLPKSDKVNSWLIDYQHKQLRLKFKLELSSFKHLGIFPEQVANWKYIADLVKSTSNCRFLNLFAYTSAASIVAAKSGAEVVNVEALKQLSQWSQENAALNNIDDVKWLVEDARAYVKRAIRRGDKFNGVIMDPPAFGHGSKGKRWIIEKHLEELFADVKQILDPEKHFLIINTYSPKMPGSQLMKLLKAHFKLSSDFQLEALGLKSQNGGRLNLGNLARIRRA